MMKEETMPVLKLTATNPEVRLSLTEFGARAQTRPVIIKPSSAKKGCHHQLTFLRHQRHKEKNSHQNSEHYS
jgi:hypothetical protein